MNKQTRIISKILEPTGDLCIKFTDEEMETLGINQGDKFSFHQEDGGILLKKYSNLDLDLNELSRQTLEMLIQESCNKDVSVNEVIESILTSVVEAQTNE